MVMPVETGEEKHNVYGRTINEMIVEEYKNFLDKDFINYLTNHYLINTQHQYGHASRPGITKGTFLYKEFIMMELLVVTYKIIEEFKVNQFKKNIHNVSAVNGMDGGWHKDDGDRTYMLIVTPTLKKDSGLFEIKDNNKVHKITFEQNKLVVFNAKLWHHYGLAPKEKGIPRITF